MDYESSSKKKHMRQSIAPNVVINTSVPRANRMSMGVGGRFGGSTRTNVQSSSIMYASRPAGELAQMSKKSVESMRDTRSKEKAEIGGLNQKLADRIEKMKFMEGQNKQLQMELEKWKAMKMFDDSHIKEIQTEEIEELRDGIKKVNDTNSKLQAENLKLRDRCDTAVEDMAILKKQRDVCNDEKEKMCRINADLESENIKLRREIELVENRRKMAEEQLVGVQDDVLRLGEDLESARIEQMSESQRALEIQDDMQFRLDCREEELEECKRLIKSMQAAEPDYSKMWEGQFKESLMKLQADCDERINRQVGEVTRSYESKMARLQASMPRDQTDSSIRKAETKTLKSEMGGMNSKISNLERENKSLRDSLDRLNAEFKMQCEECEMEKAKLKEELNDERCDKDTIEQELRALEMEKFSLEAEINQYKVLMDSGFGDESAMQDPTPGKKAQSPTDKPSKKKPDNGL